MEESRLTAFRQSYFGSAAAFCRIVTTALCALCLFLPVASYSVKIPMFIRNLSVSLKGAYDIIKSGEIEELTAMGRSTLLSDMTEKAMLVFGIFLLLALTVFTVIAFFIFSSLGVSTASRFMAERRSRRFFRRLFLSLPLQRAFLHSLRPKPAGARRQRARRFFLTGF